MAIAVVSQCSLHAVPYDGPLETRKVFDSRFQHSKGWFILRDNDRLILGCDRNGLMLDIPCVTLLQGEAVSAADVEMQARKKPLILLYSCLTRRTTELSNPFCIPQRGMEDSHLSLSARLGESCQEGFMWLSQVPESCAQVMRLSHAPESCA